MQREQHSSIIDFRHITTKAIHIAVLIIGSCLFIVSGCFSAVWFDEAYTVAAVRNDMGDMIKYLTYDVHPHLYYILLKLWSYITGSSVIALRLFSVLFGIATAVLGYTHIRKDFGEKVGFWFSFLILFSFSSFKYALQIRMYTLAIFFLTLTAIYAYRRLTDDSDKNRVLFLIFSVCSAYTHYFAFFTVAVINLFTLIRAIRTYNDSNHSLSTWVYDALVQFGAYSVGLGVFIFQVFLGGASWITVEYPKVILDTAAHVFCGDEITSIAPNAFLGYLGGFAALMLFVFLFWRLYIRYKNDEKYYSTALLALGICFAVIAFSLIVSAFRPIYNVRYSICLTSLFAFVFAYLFAHFSSYMLRRLISVTVAITFVFSSVSYIKMSFGNNTPYDEQLDNLEATDVFFTDNYSFLVAAPDLAEYKFLFYENVGWCNESAHAVFGENFAVLRDLSEFDDYIGRIWVTGGNTEEYIKSFEGTEFVAEEELYTEYYNYYFKIRLYEKKSAVKKVGA